MYEDGVALDHDVDAMLITDAAALQRVVDRYDQKYGPGWHVDVQDGAFNGPEGNGALVLAVAPTTAFGFGKDSTCRQTRWRF